MSEVKAKASSDWIKVDLQVIKEILKKIWEITKERDLGLAIVIAESYGNEKLKEDIRFLKRLIQLEASGYVKPPIEFPKLYMKVRVSS
jgi:hypothetical protein